MKMKTKLNLILTLISTWILTLAIYFAFGFFFDVFLEIIPILLAPVIITLCTLKREVAKRCCIGVVGTFLILSIAAFTGVGVIATSKPAYGVKPVAGSVEKISYSKDFMMDNYDINQKTEVKVWLPDGYDEGTKYPVLYVLDGDVLFDYTALKASMLSKEGKGDVIVVGVGYGYWNSTFARGGIIWQDEKNVRGRWRDFCFADDTEMGYMPEDFGGESKRGKEFADFVMNTVVKDIRTKYSTDTGNSTIFGHSLGGGMAAYMLTQYNPSQKDDNPFTNFVIVDNGYVEYYHRQLPNLERAMQDAVGVAHTTINVYRIWGGAVNSVDEPEQQALHDELVSKGWTNVNSYFWIPEGANHADTQTIGIDNALYLATGNPFGTN